MSSAQINLEKLLLLPCREKRIAAFCFFFNFFADYSLCAKKDGKKEEKRRGFNKRASNAPRGGKKNAYSPRKMFSSLRNDADGTEKSCPVSEKKIDPTSRPSLDARKGCWFVQRILESLLEDFARVSL